MNNNGKDLLFEDLKITDDGKSLALGIFNPDTPNKPKFYSVDCIDKIKVEDIKDFGELITRHLIKAFKNE